jgi:hypothetical protein
MILTGGPALLWSAETVLLGKRRCVLTHNAVRVQHMGCTSMSSGKKLSRPATCALSEAAGMISVRAQLPLRPPSQANSTVLAVLDAVVVVRTTRACSSPPAS